MTGAPVSARTIRRGSALGLRDGDMHAEKARLERRLRTEHCLVGNDMPIIEKHAVAAICGRHRYLRILPWMPRLQPAQIHIMTQDWISILSILSSQFLILLIDRAAVIAFQYAWRSRSS